MSNNDSVSRELKRKVRLKIVLLTQDPHWDKDERVRKQVQELVRVIDSDSHNLEPIEELTKELYLELRNDGCFVQEIMEAAGMTKAAFIEFQRENDLMRTKKTNQDSHPS